MRSLAAVLFVLASVAAPALAQEPDSEADPNLLPPPPQVILPSPPPPVATAVLSNLRKPGTESRETPGVTRPTSAVDRYLLAEMLSYFYPRVSMRNREEGTAYIEMCVDANGRASDINVLLSSGHERLDSASLTFIRNLPLKPATLDGKAVAYCGYVFGVSWMLPPLEDGETG
jgi:protein TonB